MVSQPFAIALSWMCAGERLPVKQMHSSEVHNKTIQVNGFTVLQILFESVGMCRPSIALGLNTQETH